MPADRLSAALSDRYRIERELGQGGMATVYLAEDLKHKRKVALKVLKPELAAVLGADRFVQEITTTASLQHPHILPLFDSGTVDGFLYYVMPFIEGETLRDKLNRETQLGVDEAVRIAREIADALDYAHGKGVIHRDIKPENILIQNGRPMVADFGIALAVSAAAGGRMTETGLSLGTPHYMSPEQATAEKEISARSDVYSLASVLYEMLAGQPPHSGGSAQQIIMKIIAEPVEQVTRYRKSVPPNVAAAVAKALEKLPADRFETARAFADALANPGFTTQGHSGGVTVQTTDWRHRIAVPAILVAVAAVLAAAWFGTRTPPEPPVRRFAVDFQNRPRSGLWSTIAVSPDGRRIAYTGTRDGIERLYLRSLDQLVATEVTGSDGAINPFFSPDGLHVGFMVAANAIRTASVTGTPALTVVDTLVGLPGVTWSPDGFIYYDHIGIGPLLRVRAQGGRPEPASVLDSARGELQHSWPDALPNGRGILMVVNHSGPGRQGTDTDEIAVLDTRSKQHKVLIGGIFARYAGSGHLVYVTSVGALMAVAFDANRMEINGEPVVLAEGVAHGASSGAVDLAISNDGTLWYATGLSNTRRRVLDWITRDGRVSAVDPGLSENILDVSISPDGKRAALTLETNGEDIWLKELVPGGAMDKLTFDGANRAPFWSSDGQFVDFLSFRATAADLRRVPSNGSGVPAPLFRSRRAIFGGTWSPRDEWLVFETFNQDVYGTRPGADSAVTALAAHPSIGESSPDVSPDGKWLLYDSRRTGRREVYVVPFPNTSASLKQVSTDEGRGPRWSRDGKEIFYRNANDEMVAVAVQSTAPLTLGARRVLFRLPGLVDWDVAPDGRFIAVLESGGSATATSQMNVVEGLFQELRARAPR